MPGTESSSEKFRRYRARLKARGLRQIQLWVPDINRPEFHEQISRQLGRVEQTPDDREALEWIERTADWDD